ncbi:MULTISPECIES: UDP-2,3-diacylglucosamine diphosphatase [Paraburkholderia]|uniref:UDP-2,3-diacylglucosamine diphosphatase n=1 Tax=Paraburkholderia TaxID=1822464 RepID=UPI002258A4D4|nr:MULTISPECIES: UDP-2,3-diacylglucosamine diphosphatase [Paraburkholderia]MCX4137924.1 UDP-2,3-diacylglucosamine diphosphatase [Paraburkholderia aspalathi]MCX4155192.1 UDP-2,3-diacylglucosamine diphosphatase [Paraburkholderia aspalathi]MDN7164602.1 UDP-2,3-diacylglucosamine diphosphatase [Paraburkholderia sp. SECH2]MDN7170615.1 UDP-2,3-diacylglucosamine diphosphatase [Paraburkholderia sp. SEWSISQ10-3 4]MDQ6393087.1 UDP-2,3-diacylglucosamine diphosphatase [Paraburkholderia aspalathi]
MLQETPLRSVAAGVPGEGKRPHAARPFFFLSDIHLSEAIPHTVAAFEHFVRVTAEQADSVFILGDLFEYWIGDDMLVEPFVARMAALLHTLSERGIALYIMHGNRDFLLGKRFMKAAGAIWLPDPFVITAFGTRIVLAHGDGLCTADRGYQFFRHFARNRVAQMLFLAWPFRWRQALAENMRSKSEQGRSRPVSPKYDVTPKAVAALFKVSKTATIIHGHTHRPALHREPDGTRWVLPDWDLDHGERRGGYLRIDAEGIRALPLN